ncbi:Cytochrome c oxidase polypeptide II [hydrothermal vent metagenome]|uniref:Cytochrome c oxidase polypeptide II n=1 Tax=hydrothermal vent metagenome TaxID=652676 RepID=A0A1W1BXY6_9ZZZZ
MSFETSVELLRFHNVAYTVYALLIISVIAWFSYNLTLEEKAKPMVRIPFYLYIGFLVAMGVGHHIFTYNTIPWVSEDIMRHNITPDKSFQIKMANHKFDMPSKMEIKKGEKVLFDAHSSDLVYGFGLFRQDGSMVSQMQVNPGTKNDLLWTFNECGEFDVRSTEYSGPQTSRDMYLKKVVVVTGCDNKGV